VPHAAPPGAIECDALVIGAGPVGLFQVFQLGLQGIRAQVVDALPGPGGQCTELYPDKPIYDIPAVAVCTGRELVDRLLLQLAPFEPGFHFGQEVAALAPRADGRFDLRTSTGSRFVARTVFIAAGVGAFQPRALKVDGVERHLGTQLFYRAPPPAALAGRQVLVVGGEDAAVQAALHLAEAVADRPATITLLHRRRALSADSATLTRLQTRIESGALRFEVGQILGIETGASPEARLLAVQVIGEDSQTRRLPVDALVALLGLSPKLGPVAHWGLAMERRQLVVDTAHFETGTPGIHAVGDVVTYPGKKKLILCGFHEATLAAFAAAARLHPEQPVLLQYTTTSPRLHQLLGVATPARSG
jgi:thioredoxin reductase (NADPH)